MFRGGRRDIAQTFKRIDWVFDKYTVCGRTWRTYISLYHNQVCILAKLIFLLGILEFQYLLQKDCNQNVFPLIYD